MLKHLVAAMLLLMGQPSLQAELFRQPLGLQPGDQYRLAFVTSTMRDALSSDIEDYNRFVQDTADAAPKVGTWGLTWKAMASTEQVDARDNTDTNLANGLGVPTYRVDGVLLAANYLAFWDPNENVTSTRFHVTELDTVLPPTPGGIFSGALVWTGSEQEGTGTPNGGTLGSSHFAGTGWANDSNGGWMAQGTFNSPEKLSLYAISNVITAVPEPSGLQLGIGMGALTLGFLRRLPDQHRRPKR